MIDYLEHFDASLARCTAINRGRDFFEAFYQRFVVSDRLIAERFAATDFERQREMLRESLYEMRSFYTEHTRTPYLSVLGKVHGRQGRDIPPRLYDNWIEALVETVAEHDPAYDYDTGVAWHVVLAPGIAFMQAHYDR